MAQVLDAPRDSLAPVAWHQWCNPGRCFQLPQPEVFRRFRCWWKIWSMFISFLDFSPHVCNRLFLTTGIQLPIWYSPEKKQRGRESGSWILFFVECQGANSLGNRDGLGRFVEASVLFEVLQLLRFCKIPLSFFSFIVILTCVFSPPVRWGLLDFMSVSSSPPPPRPLLLRRPPQLTGILWVQCGVLDPNGNWDPLSSVWRAGPQLRSCECSVAYRTPTAILRVQCGVPDPNRDPANSVWRPGPQPRSCEFSVASRTPTAILWVQCGVPDLKYCVRKFVRKNDRRYVRKNDRRYVRRNVKRICQKICQKECQKICQKDVRKNVRRYVRKNVRKICQKEW